MGKRHKLKLKKLQIKQACHMKEIKLKILKEMQQTFLILSHNQGRRKRVCKIEACKALWKRYCNKHNFHMHQIDG